jgi:DNA-binding transcriptional LysR family regulator
MSLRSINLNLIPILRAVLRYQSVSRAAASINLSQPTVSQALAQLRIILSDPLLVRTGQKLELTPHARELIKPVDDACEALESVLKAATFEPQNAKRIFTIAAPDHITALVAPGLLKILREVAPGVTPHFIAYSDDVGQRHRLGEVDLAVMPRLVVNLFGHADLRIVHFYTEEFVHAVGATHKLALLPQVTDADIAKYAQAIFTPPVPIPDGLGDAYGMITPSQPSGEPVAPITGRFEHLSALPAIAAGGDVVVTLPRRQALQWQGSLGLRIIGNPLPPIEICLTWSPLLDADLAHRWFRNIVRSTISDYVSDQVQQPSKRNEAAVS